MSDYLYEDLTYSVRGAVFEVYNHLGPGFKELVYHNALKTEFDLRGMLFESKKRLPISYKDEQVGVYEPDFVMDNKVLIEIKAVPEMPAIYETQLYYYLRGTGFKLGFLINFGTEKLDIRRQIYDQARKADLCSNQR